MEDAQIEKETKTRHQIKAIIHEAKLEKRIEILRPDEIKVKAVKVLSPKNDQSISTISYTDNNRKKQKRNTFKESRTTS